MSNVKRVLIMGQVPFNLHEDPDMARKLAQFNAPTFGLRIVYAKEPNELRPNSHNGQTAMYNFRLAGEEAVHIAYLKSFIDDVWQIGGKIDAVSIRDIENDVDCPLNFKGSQLLIVPKLSEAG